MESLITNWANSIRHYASALAIEPSNAAARNNRATATVYFKRLQELLDEDKQQTDQSLPQPQPGDGKPENGGDDPKDPQKGNEENDKSPRAPGDKGRGEDGLKDAADANQDKPDDKQADKKDDKQADKGRTDANETPAERARRILRENADLEKGPLTPGRREFRPPGKDW